MRPKSRLSVARIGGRLVAGGLVLLVTLAVLDTASYAAPGSLYVSDFFGATVSQYDIGAGGALAALSPPTITSGANPRMMAVSPDGHNVYVANFAGSGTEGVWQYDVGPEGLLTSKSPAIVKTVGGGTDAVAVSPDGRSLYTADNSGDDVSQFDIGANGTLTPKSPASVSTGAGSGPRRVAIAPDGGSVYVADCNSHKISQFSVGAGGALSPKTPATLTIAGCPYELQSSPDGRSLYVAQFGTPGAVYQFDIGPGGVLAPKSPASVVAPAETDELAVSPDGASVYAVGDHAAPNLVEQFSVGAGGRLAPKSTVETGAEPQGIGITSNGRSVYVSAGNFVYQYDAAADGMLSPKSTPTVPTGSSASGIGILPDQGPVAALRATSAAAGSATRFDGSGSSDPDGTVARYDWDFGDGSTAVNAGPIPNHVYANPGTYTVRLTVTDDGGCSASLIFTGQTAYCVGQPSAATTAQIAVAPSPSRPAPALATLTGLSETNAVFAVDRVSTPLSGVTSRRHRRGTIFSFRLDQPAAVTVAIRRKTAGRRVGRNCRPDSRKLHRKHRCTRYVTTATLHRNAHPGANQIKFSGRIGTRVLKPGRYLAIFTATDAAGASKPQSLSFTIAAM
jgi:DNA-binding beta-propeller fold protein YncE